MTPAIALSAIVLVPAVLLMVLRINAALVFLSLCLGNVLVQFVAPDAHSFLTLFSAHVPQGVRYWRQLCENRSVTTAGDSDGGLYGAYCPWQ